MSTSRFAKIEDYRSDFMSDSGAPSKSGYMDERGKFLNALCEKLSVGQALGGYDQMRLKYYRMAVHGEYVETEAGKIIRRIRR